MKFTILRNELNSAIQKVARALSFQTTIPILTGIKLEVNDNAIVLTASDSEISIQSTVALENTHPQIATVHTTGQVVLPAKFFVDIVKKLPHEEVHIEVNDRFQTLIVSGSAEIQLMGLDPDEFPLMPVIIQEQIIHIPSDILKNMIRQTIFAVTSNESTPILTGVLWNLTEGKLKLVATDRHRLASRWAQLEKQKNYFSNIVISGKTLAELAKLIPDNPLDIEIVVNENQVLFRFGNILFYSRLLDGAYPDTSKIMPQQYKTELIINTKSLHEAIERAYLLSRGEKTNIVHLVTLEDNQIEISSSSTELGKVKEQLQVIELHGEPFRIAFNSRYMLDALKVLDSEQIFIGFNGPMNPIVVRPRDHDLSLHLILPYRTMK